MPTLEDDRQRRPGSRRRRPAAIRRARRRTSPGGQVRRLGGDDPQRGRGPQSPQSGVRRRRCSRQSGRSGVIAPAAMVSTWILSSDRGDPVLRDAVPGRPGWVRLGRRRRTGAALRARTDRRMCHFRIDSIAGPGKTGLATGSSENATKTPRPSRTFWSPADRPRRAAHSYWPITTEYQE